MPDPFVGKVVYRPDADPANDLEINVFSEELAAANTDWHIANHHSPDAAIESQQAGYMQNIRVVLQRQHNIALAPLETLCEFPTAADRFPAPKVYTINRSVEGSDALSNRKDGIVITTPQKPRRKVAAGSA